MRDEITFSIWQKASTKSLSVKIPQTSSAKLSLMQKGQKPTGQCGRIVQNPSAELVISATPSRKSFFALGWLFYALPYWVRVRGASV
jgi:hypothetical protein